MNHIKMSTTVERHFRKMPDGLYREVKLVFLNFLNENGEIVKSKLDKTINGRLFKASKTEHSQYGEVEYIFPGQEHPTRLIALGMDYEDQRYGRR